jgi:hypothetical protein
MLLSKHDRPACVGFLPPSLCVFRDGLITTTHTDCGRLVATCKDLTGTVNPLHDFVVNPSAVAAAGNQAGASGRSCVAAAAWLDMLLVFRAPWQADVAPVLCSYKCPQVNGLLSGDGAVS